MKDRKGGVARLSRREFLYVSGASMAGVALAGSPEIAGGAEKKPKYGGRVRIGERYG